MSQKIKLAERVISASRATRAAKASRLGIMVSAILTFLIFAISYYGEVVGNFTFTIEREAQNAGITMYEDSVIQEYTSRLSSEVVDDPVGMTGYCGTEYTNYQIGDSVCIPSDEELSSIDGQNNGESYISYTFYVENAGDVAVDLSTTITLVSTSGGAEEAVRVRVIIDGVGTTYAMVQSENGESPGELEPLTEAFYSDTEVMYEELTAFASGEVIKITIVVWYEGEDADHTIEILGGGVKLDMKFEVTEVYDY
ncbi:MAG: hypothetical protein PQJ44_08045 [Sphaerochaetaceae bacterium]|nr:hypothetical protein [Sphaerochaetaceae bacterium]